MIPDTLRAQGKPTDRSAPDGTSAVGPARVVKIEGSELLLETSRGLRRARLALAYPYQPVPGDILLAVDGEPAYVIGVLQGRGRTRLRFEGDLEIRTDGRLRLTGVQGIDLVGNRVRVRADRFEVTARAVFERVIKSYRWIRETAQLHAGRLRQVIDGSSTLRAERIFDTAEKNVKIDAEQIHLG